MRGSVRFSDIVNSTVRFGAVFKNRKCYCAVRFFRVSYGAVRCGFQKSELLRCAVRCGFEEGGHPTVRVVAVNRAEPRRTDRKNCTVKNPDFWRKIP